ncbi:BamA/TamA family outer membrane protein [uncultured Bacteroides sp.]|uniref:translocation and assembly module lipoprotein TamL n=1 Tax=uncultured Bacteroides sp. TaxID=162156 RepID=UPI002AA7E8D1|nr:BamA/TamA family outer membrane protein [uncultured Bacteroides sp.]
MNGDRYIKLLIGNICLLIFWTSCSTTRNLPEGEVLYTGQKKMEVKNEAKDRAGNETMTELSAALATSPNNSILGSSTLRSPFPFGLWAYNAFVNSKKGLGKWAFKRFAAKPVFISTVNPAIRAKVGANLLHDYGFFNGSVAYEVLPDEKNPRKAKIKYLVDMKNPYLIDTVMYERFSADLLATLQKGREKTLLHEGKQFNVVTLDEERTRLSSLLQNRGYYYYRPDYFSFLADTTLVAGRVSMKIVPKAGIPKEALKRWNVGDISIHLYSKDGEVPNDSVVYKNLSIYYRDKLKIRPEVLYRQIRFQSNQTYSYFRQTRTQERMTQLGMFRYVEMNYAPRDSTDTCNALNVDIQTTYDLPLDGELDLNVTTKSNDQTGPGASFSVTRKNLFGGGENLTLGLHGSYEWQTGTGNTQNTSALNSYEMGISASLAIPKVLFPRLGKNEYDFPASTTFNLYADQLNRARFFKMLSFGGDVTYVFNPTRVSRHTITPFKLTFNVLNNPTALFDSISAANPALYLSLNNQFVPSMSYKYTYDNASLKRAHDRLWWETSITSAGNITSCIYRAFGKKFNEQKDLLGAPFAQFLKFTSEVRYTWNIDKNQSIATRLAGGLIYSYGNSDVAPYSEQFYVGGANSIRAFTVRSIGPGSYKPAEDQKYSYLDQTGDIKMEANVEYRFRILQDLHGAVFLDAGNVWLLRNDPKRSGAQFGLNGLMDEIALGTGAGLRYDLSYLVIRLDCGVGIHAPYTTSRKGYYNIPSFKDGLGWHLAIGYPF